MRELLRFLSAPFRAHAEAAAARKAAAQLAREVDEHRATLRRLAAKESDLQVVTDTMSAAVARCSRDRRYLWVNRLYAEWLSDGRTAEEIVGRTLADVLGEEADAAIRPHVVEVLAGRRVEFERYARSASGRRWIHVSLQPTFDKAEGGREASGWVAVIHDIDESRRAAEALRTAQEQLQVVTDTMSAGVCRTGNDLRFEWMNPVYARWVGQPAERLVGRPVADIVGPEQMRVIAPYLARVLQKEQVQYERLATFPGLGQRWISAMFTPILDAEGNLDGWVTILTDIHDRKMAEQALQAADRRKDDFLATLAHELRNPLAPIRNAVAILGRKGTLDPEIDWSREVIGRQVEQMSRLVDDLLDIERISRGKLLVRRERIALERTVDMALEMSRPYINAAGHRLSVLMPAEPVTLDADPTRLAQVFSNLLNNAAKFTGPQGEISLSAHVEGREVVVKVEDNGMGFAPDMAAQLFKPYEQLTGARDSAPGGLGIGLSLVDGIVALHGGRVEARSPGPGLGAEFSVRLPIAAQREAPQALAAPAPAASRRLRILVADDNRDAADSLQRILTHQGHSVRVAYDGRDALALEGGPAPQVAVLDIGMPAVDGYEVARALRSRHGKSITLIAQTGWGQDSDRRRAMEAGFDYHLTKPVDPGSLNDLLLEAAKNEEEPDSPLPSGGGDGRIGS